METRIAVQEWEVTNDLDSPWKTQGWFWPDNMRPVDDDAWQLLNVTKFDRDSNPIEATFKRTQNTSPASTPAGSCMQKPADNIYDNENGVQMDYNTSKIEVKDNILKVGGVVYELRTYNGHEWMNKSDNEIAVATSYGSFIGKPLPFDGEKKAEEPKPSYTITAFRSKIDGAIVYRKNGSAWFDARNRRGIEFSWLSCNSDYEIYSVKNAAGLKIVVGNRYNHQLWKAAVVQKLIKPEGINSVFATLGQDGVGNDMSYPIDFLSPASALFTTEDGIEVFEGQEVWSVSLDTWVVVSWQNPNNAIRLQNSNINDAKYFSTKEKAEAYVRINKPMLSLEDVHKSFFQQSLTMQENELLSQEYNKLKNTVLSRLKTEQ